jgi:aminocarboxymuconate-semialdehyde decarboxylase
VRAETSELSKTSPLAALRRLYFDTLVFEPQALRYLIDLVGADRICIGTDSPFDMGDEQPAATVAAIPRLTLPERHQICCGTALRLLGEGR